MSNSKIEQRIQEEVNDLLEVDPTLSIEAAREIATALVNCDCLYEEELSESFTELPMEFEEEEAFYEEESECC